MSRLTGTVGEGWLPSNIYDSSHLFWVHVYLSENFVFVYDFPKYDFGMLISTHCNIILLGNLSYVVGEGVVGQV